MQEVEKTVDIDTSGPDTEVEINQEEQSTDTAAVESTETSSTEPVEPVAEETTVDTKSEEKEATEEKKDELKEYSEGVQRRIAKLTKKQREAERQKEEAAEFAKAQIKLREEAEAKISKLEPGYLQSTEDSITSGLQAAQAKLAAAREAQDLAAESEALTAISELGYKKAKLAETKVAQEEFKKQQEAKPKPEVNLKQQPAQTTPDPKAEQWAAKNTWFGQDTAMTYTAFDLHKKLTEDEGYDPQSDEYYSEIDKRIRLEFPNKFGNNTDTGENTAKPVQQVASAKRSTNTGRKNTVRLTSSQVAIAKKLGVPLEEYAKQLKITKEVQHMENDKRTSRASQTREKTSKPKVWTPPSSLDAPPAPTGFQHRWLRAESLGFNDSKNIQGRLRSGYELVRSDEYPDSDYPVVEDGKYKGVIGVGGLVLARVPVEIAKSRSEYYAKMHDDKVKAVDSDLMKEQHPDMPINIDRQSRVTFGGSKKS